MNFNINNHLFMFSIVDGYLYLVLKNENSKLVIPKYSYDGTDSIEKNVALSFYKETGIKGQVYHQCHTYSNKLNLDITFVSFTDNKQNINNAFNWYLVNDLDKNLINKDILDYLKVYLNNSTNLKKLFPNSFSLIELQRLFEYLYSTNLDRRNFRKKLISQNIIKSEDELKKKTTNGRPNKLYSFTDLDGINIM